jgi:histidinol-phosphate aminotransferase
MSGAAGDLVRLLVRDEVRASSAYHVQDTRGLIRLDQMESPFGWPSGLRGVLAERLAAVQINRYPDPRAAGVQQRLRDAFGIPARWNIMPGNGSDEIIQIITSTLAVPGGCVMAPSPTFVMFRVLAGWAGMSYEEVPLAEDFSLDADAMCAAIAERQPRLIFLACPNNPTGNMFDAESLDRVVRAAAGSLVVIDEAYWAFSSRDHLDWLDRHSNLVILRTLSKLGLAGLRLGFLVGDPAWVGEFDKVRLPYNVGVLHQAAAEVALEHFGVLREQTRIIAAERARLAGIVGVDPRLHLWPGEANFLLVRVLSGAAKDVHAAMIRHGVLVKCLDGGNPRLAGCLRLGVGTAEENARMLAALDAALSETAA